MDISEHEAIWASARAQAKQLSEETRVETLHAEMHLGWLNMQIEDYALSARDRAMLRGDSTSAMDFLETALDARERGFEASELALGFQPLAYMYPHHIQDAAIAGRMDLIDRALALEIASKSADAYADDGYDVRIASLERIKASFPHYKTIRDVVEREPGVLQIDLLAHCPGADNRMVSKMVDRLAVVGILVTEKIGSRVHVWPPGHGDAPTGDRIRQPQNPAGDTARWQEIPSWHSNPEQPLQWALNLRHRLRTSLANPDWDTSPIPEPADFSPIGLSAADGEGHLCHLCEEPDEMVIWGHIDEATLRRIFERYVEKFGVQSRRLKKWRTAEVRHTHLERVSYQGRERSLWLLSEAREATGTTIPVTAFVSPGASPRSRPGIGQVIWLDKRDR